MNKLQRLLLLGIALPMLAIVLFWQPRFDRDWVDAEDTREFHKELMQVLVNVFDRSSGLFHYSVSTRGKLSDRNNAIRQLLGSRVLAENSHDKESLLELHRQNLQTLMTRWYRVEGDIGYVLFKNKSKLGANAMLLRVILASPDYQQFGEQARQLVNGILSLMEENGAFRPWLIEPDYEYDANYLLTFYSGEALLALFEYVEKSGNQTVLAQAIHSQDYYLNRYVRQMALHYYPAYVPWHTQSLYKAWQLTDDEKYANAILVLNNKVLELQDQEHHRGRFYNPETPQYGKPHSSSDAVYVEGLAVARKLAVDIADDDHQVRYNQAIRIGLEYLQYNQLRNQAPINIEGRDLRINLNGGIVTKRDGHWVRIDTTAHALDALAQLQ